MRLKSLVFVLLFLANSSAFAQSVDTAWVRTYVGGYYGNGFTGIALDASGNIYVTGYTSGFDLWYHDYILSKYKPDGTELWVEKYNGPGNADDVSTGIAMDHSGNVYVTGWSAGSQTSSSYDIATIKYDEKGNDLWVVRYNGPAGYRDIASDLAVDSYGNIYVTGYCDFKLVPLLPTASDYVTIKYDSSGNELWVRRYNGPGNGNDFASNIAIDSSGNVYVTGVSPGNETADDYATIKYDSAGTQIWVRRYNGPGNDDDEAHALAVDNSGNVYVTGESYSSTGDQDYATIKYHPDGDTAWVRRYKGPEDDDMAYALVIDTWDNVYITGESYSGDVTVKDYVTIKYDADGNELWTKRYDRQGHSEGASSIAVDVSGNVYVTGNSGTIKYDVDGKQLWATSSICPYYPSSDIALDTSSDVYVCGATSGDIEAILIKYVQEQTSIGESDTQALIHLFTLYQNYPNPFNRETTIEYSLHKTTSVNLTVYNIKGQEVKELVDEFQTAGMKSVTWDGKDNSGRTVASGIYVYKLKTDKYVVSKKMLLLK